MPTDPRQRLLDLAERRFAERGYDAVGVQELVQACGVTKPTLYHHFGSKRGLLEALLAERGAAVGAPFEAACAYAHDLGATLERVLRTTASLAAAAPDFHRLVLSLWLAPPESEAHAAAAPFFARRQAALEALFRAAARDHGNMKGRHRIYAATFLGTLHTWVALALGGQVRLDEALVRRAVHQFQHGIYS